MSTLDPKDRRVAELAVQLGWVTSVQLRRAVKGQPEGVDLLQRLVRTGLLKPDQADSIATRIERESAVADVADMGETLHQSRGEAPAPARASDTGPPSLRGRIRETYGVDLSRLPSSTDGEARSRVARHRVTDLLGAGGMGEVMEVVDDDLGRKMAAKVIHGRHDALLIERFVQEAQITGQLEHPNIPPLHELGMTEDGRLYFTMKKVVGEDLKAVLERAAQAERGARKAGERAARRGRKSPRKGLRSRGAQAEARSLMELLNVFVKVCDGIAFAHSHGIIHRDLKPANIMIGSFGEVQIMDWGLAKTIGERDLGAEALAANLPAPGREMTVAGDVVGTPSYMPPEQARGQIDALGVRSDVYSLGAILYEILTLRAPFEGENPFLLLDAVVREPLVPPSERAPHRDVPWELEAVVTKAMAKGPGDRYQTVLDLRRDIASYLEGVPLEAADYTTGQLVMKFVQRYKLQVGSAAVVLISLLALLGNTLNSQRIQLQALDATKTALAEARTAREKEAESRQKAESARAEEQAARTRAEAASAEEKRARERAELLVRLQGYARTIDETRPYFYIARIDIADKIAELEESIGELAQLAASPAGARSAEAQRLLGMGYYFLEDFDAARLALQKAHALAPEDGLVAFYLARVYLEGGIISVFTGSGEMSERMLIMGQLQKAAGLMASAGGLDPADAALAKVLGAFSSGQHERARQLAGEGLETHAGQLGVADFHVARGLTRLSLPQWIQLAMASRSKRKEQMKAFDAMRADWDRALAARPHYPQARILRAALHLLVGDRARALPELNAALAVNPRLVLVLRLRSRALLDLKRYFEAHADFDELVELRGSIDDYYYRAECQVKQGKNAGARPDLERVARHADFAGKSESFRRGLFNRLGWVRAKTGDRAGATRAFEEALKLSVKASHRAVIEKNMRRLGLR